MTILSTYHHPNYTSTWLSTGLGSSASTRLSNLWITDNTGKPIQHLHYLPFGEEWIDQKSTSWNAPYSFTGKIKDTETGYNYFGARYYDSQLSVWISVDPLSDKYPSMSPYTYCANNPVVLLDPDGRKIMGTDSNPINYTKNNDGTIKWTSNTSADVKLLGSIMLKTKVGTFFFDAMKNAKHDITIKIDNTEKTDKTKLGETENSYSQSLNGEDILNPNKIFESKITIFQNTIENKLNSPDGNKGGFSIAVAMAAVLVHEAVHATDFSNMIASLKYDLFKHADMYDFWYNNKEYEPERQRYLFLKEYNNLNK